MAGGSDEFEPPTPAHAFELAKKHATLLRHLFTHPQFRHLQPPTAAVAQIDTQNMPVALLFVSQFIQTTYIDYVLPFLPPGATRKCKDIANPWAYADPNYQWEWVWDDQDGALKDRAGKAIQFPTIPEKTAISMVADIFSRGFMTRKVVLENGTDTKARLMIGGEAFDFGEDIRKAVEDLYN